jgi:hypothetical protein
MDAMTGRQQTTKGVWLAKAPRIDEVCTLILDLEGSDGRERGEDDTNFERQSALFALAVADVLLINVWCHDIGREQGSGKPLMKTIFQVGQGSRYKQQTQATGMFDGSKGTLFAAVLNMHGPQAFDT